VRAVAKLAKRAARDETGFFLVEGPQAVREMFAYRPELVVDLFITASSLDRHGDYGAAAAGIEPEIVTDAVLETMADTITPQGVIGVCRHIHVTVPEILERAPKLVAILDEVRDPGNAGTIIRAADAAGADAVVFTGKHVDAYNPKVVRSTTGSLFHLPVAQNGPLDEALTALRAAGIQIIAADVKGAPLPRVRGLLPAPTAWLFGNEAHGLADETLALADRVVRLPIYGHAESLNLATAASVCLYESAFAQRG
ncbi:MAG TPA: RNA methyltransferase, partial [Pseudolysinimonas sp.]|nr:RNA methyltransferase [Pseudolysinimonas sp.]